MHDVHFARKNLGLCRIGFGGAAIGGYDYGPVDDSESIGAIHAALDAGVTVFDVADVYGLGRAERILGRALAAAGSRRHDALVATKVGVRWDATGSTRRDLSPSWIAKAIDDSLRRLKIERIGLYQIHWPDGERIRDETVTSLLRCQESGKAAHLGACNMSISMLPQPERFETLQLPFSLLERGAEDDLTSAKTAKMTTFAYNVLGRGLLTGKFDTGASFAGTDTRRTSTLFAGEVRSRARDIVTRLQQIAREYDKTPAQVAIRWALGRPGVDVALVGAKTAAQVMENVGAMELTLSKDAIRWLDSACDSERLTVSDEYDYEIT